MAVKQQRKKAEQYAVGILLKGNKIKYVTSLGEGHYAKWEAGEEAMLFSSKQMVSEMCRGFAFNGIPAIVIVKTDYINLRNEEEEEKEN